MPLQYLLQPISDLLDLKTPLRTRSESHLHRFKSSHKLLDPIIPVIQTRPRRTRRRQRTQRHSACITIGATLVLFQSHLSIYLPGVRSERTVDGVVPAGQDGVAGDVAAALGEGHVEVGIGGLEGEE